MPNSWLTRTRQVIQPVPAQLLKTVLQWVNHHIIVKLKVFRQRVLEEYGQLRLIHAHQPFCSGESEHWFCGSTEWTFNYTTANEWSPMMLCGREIWSKRYYMTSFAIFEASRVTGSYFYLFEYTLFATAIHAYTHTSTHHSILAVYYHHFINDHHVNAGSENDASTTMTTH